jgi:hypothetical protein
MTIIIYNKNNKNKMLKSLYDFRKVLKYIDIFGYSINIDLDSENKNF